MPELFDRGLALLAGGGWRLELKAVSSMSENQRCYLPNALAAGGFEFQAASIFWPMNGDVEVR